MRFLGVTIEKQQRQCRSSRRMYIETGNLEIPFVETLTQRLLETSELRLDSVLKKAAFWNSHAQTPLNERQRKIINRLFDGFDGPLTSSKWAKICKCSPDSALRDINDLIGKGILTKSASAGRSTHYELG